MASKVIMPKLSPTMEEGQIARWLKKEGDKVSMGEPLAEIDTDKATMEMQALSNGVLRKILINEGESAPLGQLIAVIGEPNEDISALLSEAPPAKTESPKPAPPRFGELRRADAHFEEVPSAALKTRRARVPVTVSFTAMRSHAPASTSSNVRAEYGSTL